MRKEAIAQGATIEEAKAAAVAQLGVDEADVTFEVLQEPQKKTFGLFGGALAEVKAVYEKEEAPAEAAAAYLKDILTAMGVGDTVIDIREKEEENGCVLALTGDHPTVGDGKEALPVYDLDSVGILTMLTEMEATGTEFITVT